MMQREAAVDDIGRSAGVLVGEKPGVDWLDVPRRRRQRDSPGLDQATRR